MSLFKTIAIGRLTKDPSVREVNVKGAPQKVANFAIAVDHDFGDGTDFVDVVVWRKEAENVERFLNKGRLVAVEGRMQKRTYTAKTPEGHEYPRDVWELVANSVQFLDKPTQGGQTGGQQSTHTQQPAPQYDYQSEPPF